MPRFVKTVLPSVLILIVCLGSAFAGGNSEIPISPTNNSTEIDANGQNGKVLTIAIGTDPTPFAGTLYEGLCSYNPETALAAAGLAKNWGQSLNGLEWFFTLRDNLKYSDGSPIRPEDFLNSWIALADSGNANASMLDVIVGFRDYRNGLAEKDAIGFSADGNEITISLTERTPYFAMILATPCFAPKYLSQSFSGPYSLEKANLSYALLTKNTYYWNSANVQSEKVKLDLRGSSEAVYHDFQDGVIQWAACYIPDEYTKNDEYIASHQWATSFFYWMAKDGPYADPEVRRILTSVIPWETIRYIVSGPLPTYAFVPDSRAKQKIKTLKNENARKQLKAAGYNELPELNLSVPEGTQIVTAASLIAEIWKRVFSIRVNYNEVEDISSYVKVPSESDCDFAWINWIGDYYDPIAFLNLFSAKSGYNIANYNNPEYDELLDKARNSIDNKERAAALLAAEQYLLDSFALIPIENPIATNFVKLDMIEGWYDNALDVHPLKDIKFAEQKKNGVLTPYPMN